MIIYERDFRRNIVVFEKNIPFEHRFLAFTTLYFLPRIGREEVKIFKSKCRVVVPGINKDLSRVLRI